MKIHATESAPRIRYLSDMWDTWHLYGCTQDGQISEDIGKRYIDDSGLMWNSQSKCSRFDPSFDIIEVTSDDHELVGRAKFHQRGTDWYLDDAESSILQMVWKRRSKESRSHDKPVHLKWIRDVPGKMILHTK